jgi:hypothetical protein
MSDERRDDEIIGRALSRAIETIDVNQTPFERSRIATTPARRSIFGLWQIATAAAAIVLALAIGSWLTRPTEGQPGVAASPTAPASSAPSVAPTATPVQAPIVPIWVYFARDGLPPVGASIDAHASSAALASVEGRIGARISALSGFGSGSIPAGATDPMSLVAKPAPTAGSSHGSMGVFVSVQGDVAKVEFDLNPGWGVRGAAQSQALLQQLVYTITEEPGINRALITEKGKPNAVIDQLVIDKPLTRDDVSGYSVRGSVDPLQVGGDTPPARLSTTYSVDSLAPGLARFVITVDDDTPTGSSNVNREFTVALLPEKQATSGKFELEITLPNASDATTAAAQVDRSPLRWIAVGKSNSSSAQTYRLGLDDARPWRVFTLSNPSRIVVDIGGDPRTTSDRIAVTTPKPGDRVPGGAQFAQSVRQAGVARVFEATVSWRVRDAAGKVVASSHFNASLGSSALWGTFDSGFAVPASVHGSITLEVFEASPKDGSDVGLVAIPLTVP